MDNNPIFVNAKRDTKCTSQSVCFRGDNSYLNGIYELIVTNEREWLQPVPSRSDLVANS